MPSKNNKHAPSQGSAQSAPKSTAKYTNKDGTKYISVPKSSASTPPAQPSPTTTSSSRGGGAPTNPPVAAHVPPAQPVNRKKQKRRAKAAAKAAAEQAEAEAEANGLPSPASTSSAPLPVPSESRINNLHNSRGIISNENHHSHIHTHNGEDWGDDTESDEDDLNDYAQPSNGTTQKGKKSKKKKKKGVAEEPVNSNPSGISKEKIWNTSGPEERERIKQFWLGLGEDERKSLVKVEKDAVLKKMKEQQKHTCSCSVCGRKRTAIEEELEGLYDAYYQELESFANQPHHHPNAPFSPPPPPRFGPMSGLHPPGAPLSRFSNHHHPSHGRIVEHVDNDEEEEEDVEEYSDVDGLDEEEDEEEEPEEIPRESYANDFFNFGQSLQVKGGILTVADDLLKNDGKKFIEMMEQLAERRMAREEDAKDHYVGGYGHGINGNSMPNHNHPPPEDDEFEDDEEEEEEYDSQDEDYEEEEDTMTEEQRMEEGRRMFQIFAARMFEQRVLTAYREKVARERQEKLLEELEEEETQESQRKAKKAKEAQKRKDKAAQKKQAQLEEKAKRDAAKAAEDAARLADETRKLEEARLKAEERRKKKDAQKKAEEEERQKRELERQRRAHEQKEKQLEQERKKEREKKLKEEQRRREQEARELKERETRERREKHERDKREKELRAAQSKAERDAKEKSKQEEKEKAAAKAATPAAPIPTQPAKKQQHPVSIPALPHQPSTGHASNHPSPQVAVATPALPKAPTPMKPRSASQEVTRSVSQASHSASGPSQNASPHTLTPLHTSPGPIGPPRKISSTGPTSVGPPGAQPASPLHTGFKSPSVSHQGPFNMGLPMQYPPGIAPPQIPPPGFNRMHEPMYPPPGNFRPMGMPVPPGFSAPSPMGGRAFPIPHAPPGFHQPVEQPLPGMHHPGFSPDSTSGQPPSHSRQTSASFDTNPLAGAASQPIGRPAPIGRPGSVVHGQGSQDLTADIDDVSNHLGSSALLEDTDEPFGDVNPSRRGTAAPGARAPFPSAPFIDPFMGSPLNAAWGPTTLFSPPPGFANPAWPTFSAPAPSIRPAQPRSIAIRRMLISACKELEAHAADGYIELPAIKGHIDNLNLQGQEPVSEKELLDMCDTEGNLHNGGGSFSIQRVEGGKVLIRYEPDPPSASTSFNRNVGAPGEIGSPIVGAGSPHHSTPGV
ncbi:salt tolerance down-regulator-domain-containing protein [Hypoxylon trugodes]|uniref:salt tolerance down-regulator-domain-containing protein n=1 Tax=Hypoxylon trugodes TaxID=326681 RepID=UPI00219EF342|nr:salt tolerance down-regulator-domain-containing protein [Hypoxylon trugodes]KAI1383091.1 salt tolerance down-regulator-domain-containing protein [Hypoxylon trugodes]